MAPLMPSARYKLRRDGLAGAADLAVHGQPAFIADRARCGDFPAQRFGQGFSALGNIFRGFDAAADGNEQRGLRQVHGLLWLRVKSSSGFVRISLGFKSTLTEFTRSFRRWELREQDRRETRPIGTRRTTARRR